MEYRELKIKGAWEITPKQFPDERGAFMEMYKLPEFAQVVGHPLHLVQANCSISKAGVVRGIHFADVPPSQAKYVMCPRGAVLDFAVDIRVGSPTFGQWDSVLLEDENRRAIYLSEGLGHCFVALEDDSTVVYLCSEGYNPGHEHGVSPVDPTVALAFPDRDLAGRPLEILLSEKDTAAPTLAQAQAQGLLPDYQAALDYVASLNS